nr:integrase, catalytic region, zinc finger, CCHC-type, peptidase aspartic, catalytic [Tanacetum cinerariifolium]
MTGNLKLLCNFVENFLGTVRFGNDQFAPILGYGDLVQGNITINSVYYVKGLNHNLFSVGQFCDADLEVAFRKSTCFVRDLQDFLISTLLGIKCTKAFPLLEESSYWQYNFPLPVEGVPTAKRMEIPLLKSLHCYDEETASQRELARFDQVVGVTVDCGPIASGVKHLFGGVVRAMVSPSGSIMASLKNVNGFMAVNTPPDDLIRTDYEQEEVVPKSEGQSLHASRPSRLYAQAQSVDDMPFRKQACTSTPDGCFCSLGHDVPGGSIVASLENDNGFLAMYTPSDDLIRTDFKQKGSSQK